jgi:uracil-DNA glycosylase family protein
MELGTPFFVRRFGDKPWSIFSADASAHWNMKALTFGPGMTQQEFGHDDPFDEIWKTYYKSIFNPARIKIKMMKTEMAPKYWSALPEAEIIQELIRNTPKQLQNMRDAIQEVAHPPATTDWNQLKAAALACASCPLAKTATQTVFGEGNLRAPIMIVGEQPGDNEDIAGHNFIGPAGELLNKALAEAGILRRDLYVTNAVKHFKFEWEGKLRLHKKSSGREMHACKPWLEAEIAMVRPTVILCLGATASTAVYGRLVKIQVERGAPYTESGMAKNLLVSWHPAVILRSSLEIEKQQRYQELVSDLRVALALSKLGSGD